MSTRRTQPTEDDERWMRTAIEEAQSSDSEGGKITPKVGAVIVDPDGNEVARAHRGESAPGRHAEFCALLKLAGGDEDAVDGLALPGHTVYTTLEPCTARGTTRDGKDKIPCAERLVRAGVSRVWIGEYDPNPKVYRVGYRALLDAGIEVCDFSAELRDEVAGVNSDFVAQYRRGVGSVGSATFDYTQNDGVFVIVAESHQGAPTFRTRWTPMGPGSIYAYGDQGSLALARGARSFEDIDDPEGFEFASHSEPVREGEIAIFRGTGGFVLVQVTEVLKLSHGGPRDSISIDWQLRLED